MKKHHYLTLLAITVLTITTPTEGRGQNKMSPSSVPLTPAGQPAEKPLPPSEFSKSIADKVFIGTAMGFTGLSGDKGDWNSAWAGDIRLGYQILPAFLDGKLAATFRYAPTDILVEKDNHPYTGVVQMYHFGGLWQKKIDDIDYIGSAELSLVSISLSARDHTKEDESLEDGSVNITLGGGADFSVLDKVTAGPRIYFGMGSLSYYQIGGAISFLL